MLAVRKSWSVEFRINREKSMENIKPVAENEKEGERSVLQTTSHLNTCFYLSHEPNKEIN